MIRLTGEIKTRLRKNFVKGNMKVLCEKTTLERDIVKIIRCKPCLEYHVKDKYAEIFRNRSCEKKYAKNCVKYHLKRKLLKNDMRNLAM